MDTIFYLLTILKILLVCHHAKTEDEKITQNGPPDDSLRMFKYLQLYQQRQRLANSKTPYANRLSSGYYNSQRSGTGEEDSEREPYEYFRGPSDQWNKEEVRRYHNEGERLRQVPSSQLVKSEAPSGYIAVQVFSPREDIPKYEEGSTQITDEAESNTLKTELLHEEKKSPQELSSDTSLKLFAAQNLPDNGPISLRHSSEDATKAHKSPFSDFYFIVIVAGCSAAAIFGVITAGYCFYKFQKTSKAAAEVDYPAYGVTGPSKEHTSPSGDRKLAHSAQMYHYQHQKQQMIAVENATTNRQTSNSDVDSEEENEEGDYTVYECPGLAPTGEMEVKNPLFHDDSTPMSPPVASKEMKKP